MHRHEEALCVRDASIRRYNVYRVQLARHTALAQRLLLRHLRALGAHRLRQGHRQLHRAQFLRVLEQPVPEHEVRRLAVRVEVLEELGLGEQQRKQDVHVDRQDRVNHLAALMI